MSRRNLLDDVSPLPYPIQRDKHVTRNTKRLNNLRHQVYIMLTQFNAPGHIH